MRIIITASRNWDTPHTLPDIFRARLLAAIEEHAGPGPHVLVHGAARGGDRIAADVARRQGWEHEPHPAKWNTFGASAGPLRNQKMVDLGADLCLGFPLDTERGISKGTHDCMNRARKAGIPTINCFPLPDRDA